MNRRKQRETERDKKGRIAHGWLRSTTDGESEQRIKGEQRIVKGKNSHAKLPESRDRVAAPAKRDEDDKVRDKVNREVGVTFSISIMIVFTVNGFSSPQAYSELSGANLVPNLVDWLRLGCSRLLCGLSSIPQAHSNLKSLIAAGGCFSVGYLKIGICLRQIPKRKMKLNFGMP